MKTRARTISLSLRGTLSSIGLLGMVLLGGLHASASVSAAEAAGAVEAEARIMPWETAGIGPRAAAAHLLDRFAYGPGPGDIEHVLSIGLEAWLERQLAPQPDPILEARLEGLPSLALSAAEIRERYASFGRLRRLMAQSKESAPSMATPSVATPSMATPSMADPSPELGTPSLRAFARRAGLRTEIDLISELEDQKLLRAVYGRNQLLEVMTTFWLDHFHVSTLDSEVRLAITSYERDAIRPHALGDFASLLHATARHPAMLVYLDNARSTAAPGAERRFALETFIQRRGRDEIARLVDRFRRQRDATFAGPPARGGVNENYARELLELHTLGVDGGYTEQDVREVARAFTGWTLMPTASPGRMAAHQLFTLLAERQGSGYSDTVYPDSGYVVDDAFLFRADHHDADAKVVLGTPLPAGRGIEDGHDVLDRLAAHPSTARHLARKLAVRFVSDDPPEDLVDDLATVFLVSGGDIRAMLRAITRAPAFWSHATGLGKIKRPFELAASALRATDAQIAEPWAIMRRIADLGQPVYAASAPDGFPDDADAWLHGGTLMARLRFGLDLAQGMIGGIEVDADTLAGRRHGMSHQRAIERLVARLLPGRDAFSHEHLLMVLHDPLVSDRLADEIMGTDELIVRRDFEGPGGRWIATRRDPTLATALGLLLGSSAFQRR